MKLAKISLVAAIAVGLLLAFGNVASAQDAGKDTTKKGKKGMPTIEQRMERYDKELKLTDEQKPKVKALLGKYDKKRQEALGGDTNLSRQEMREKLQPIMEEQNKEMKKILTADQYKKYEELGQRMRGKGGKKGDAAQSDSKKKSE